MSSSFDDANFSNVTLAPVCAANLAETSENSAERINAENVTATACRSNRAIVYVAWPQASLANEARWRAFGNAMLLARLKETPSQAARRSVALPTHLTVRESTGPARSL
jgi:hypothetical protein